MPRDPLVECSKLLFSRHAVQRMFDRSISAEEIRLGLNTGRKIEVYPEDRPFPSALILSFRRDGSPLHIVASQDEAGVCYIITVYIPDVELWSEDFSDRRS